MIATCERYFRGVDAIIEELVALAGPGRDRRGRLRPRLRPVARRLPRQLLARARGPPGVDARRRRDRRRRRHRGRLRGDDAPRPRGRLVAHDGLRRDAEQPGHPRRRPDPRHGRADARGGATGARATRSPASCARSAGRTTTRRSRRRSWTREEAFPGPYAALGPDVSMVLADAGTISILPSSRIVARRPEPRGHHRWEGIFLAAGPGIRAGASVDELSIVDVAPLLLHRLGLPVPDDMTGRVPVEILEPAELAANPPRTVAATFVARPRRRPGRRRPRAGRGGARDGAPARPRIRRVTSTCPRPA